MLASINVPPSVSKGQVVLISILFCASGFVGLVYQVLWMKELGLLFGNSSQAAATTLVAFFLGLAVGGYVWGKRSKNIRHPLRTYALLEVGVVCSALLYYVLLDTYYLLYSPLFQIVGDYPTVFVTLKFVLAVVILFLPAFFMGGTLPLMSQHLVRNANSLGKTTSLLYAVNTLGGALGAYMAGFHLPPLMGFDRTYVVALILTGGVALLAWVLSYFSAPPAIHQSPSPPEKPPTLPLMSWNSIRALAFLSGFVALSVEILWTRMFSQVLQNSVYTFSTVLVIFLVSLALGAWLASFLARYDFNPLATISILLLLSALLIGLTPFLFSWTTNGLQYLGGKKDWIDYMVEIFRHGGTVMLVPGICLGSIFPYLLKMSEAHHQAAGETVGHLIAINTLGAIVGSVSAGFVFMPLWGLWNSIRLMAVIYLLVVLFLVPPKPSRTKLFQWAAAFGLLLLITVFEPSSVPLIRVDPVKKKEVLYEYWEGSNGTVAVVKRKNSLKIKVNNYYSLGGTGAKKWEAKQSHLPLLIHPNPKSVFYLGMGTGITAGAALSHPVERVVVSELIPEVVEAAEKYFQPHLNGLFTDQRASIVTEDGRNYLLGTSEQFDVIIADLFIPWRAGVGSLYTQEHFVTIHQHLKKGGLFAQWLPLYQLTEADFGGIARTMLEAFPQVTMWRGDFLSRKPIVVLIGHQNDQPFQPYDLSQRMQQVGVEFKQTPVGHFPFFSHYAGNLSSVKHLFNSYLINTDDLPLIEYQAPISHRQQKARQSQWFVQEKWTRFVETVLTHHPPANDPYLKNLPTQQYRFPHAGLFLHQAKVAQYQGNSKQFTTLLYQYHQQVKTHETLP